MNDFETVGGYHQSHPNARQSARGHDGSSAGEFTFGDFLDIINPLQHIPIVSTLYREITGDEISPHARILGDTLFGGPAGFLSSIANVFYEEVAGEDVGETVLAFFGGGDDGAEPQFAEEADPAVSADGLPAAFETAAGEPDAPGVLTGQDALNALFVDLRRHRPDEAAAPAAVKPAEGPRARSYPLPPRTHHASAAMDPDPTGSVDAPEAATHPLLFAQEHAEGAVAERMMQALDKYRAMARESDSARRREEENPQEEQVLWQSDPATGS